MYTGNKYISLRSIIIKCLLVLILFVSLLIAVLYTIKENDSCTNNFDIYQSYITELQKESLLKLSNENIPKILNETFTIKLKEIDTLETIKNSCNTNTSKTIVTYIGDETYNIKTYLECENYYKTSIKTYSYKELNIK